MSSPVFVSDMDSWERPDGITVFRRKSFPEYFDYKPGQHVVFGGPSTFGKTTLALQLVDAVATPELPAYIAVSKPSDPVTARETARMGFRRVEDWPAPKKLQEMFGGSKPRGYVIWPPFGDLNTDMERCAEVTGRLINERYAKGANPKSKGGILVMDDTMVKAKLMGLDNHMVTILAMAGAMKLGLWIFVQKPTDSGRTTLWGYENAIHMFFTKGGDARMLNRYAEIIGEHGKEAKQIIPTLKPFEFLYIHKVEGWMCIVGAN